MWCIPCPRFSLRMNFNESIHPASVQPKRHFGKQKHLFQPRRLVHGLGEQGSGESLASEKPSKEAECRARQHPPSRPTREVHETYFTEVMNHRQSENHHAITHHLSGRRVGNLCFSDGLNNNAVSLSLSIAFTDVSAAAPMTSMTHPSTLVVAPGVASHPGGLTQRLRNKGKKQ